jgi:hypothetical protein
MLLRRIESRKVAMLTFFYRGATPSQIGVVLRDSHGIAQVKVVTGNKILRILKSNGMDLQRFSQF